MRFIILACAILAASPVLAAEAESARYQLERVGDGFIRLDRDTGAVLFCVSKADHWQCDPVQFGGISQGIGGVSEGIGGVSEGIGGVSAGIGSGSEGLDNASIEGRLQAIEHRIAVLESQPKIDLPSDQDIDRALDIFGKFMDRFKDFARDLNAEKPTVPK